MSAPGRSAAVVAVLLLSIVPLGSWSSASAQVERSPGAELCPSTLPVEGGEAPLEAAGTQAAQWWSELFSEYTIGCLYELELGSLDFHLKWTEHPMHRLHRACEDPGFVGEMDEDHLRGHLVFSDRGQAAVTFTPSPNSEVSEEEIAQIEQTAKALLETLEGHAAPCTSAFIVDRGWPTCPETLTGRYRDNEGNTTTVAYTLGRADRETDDHVRRELRCGYARGDGASANGHVRWRRPFQTALERNQMTRDDGVQRCHELGELPGHDVSAGFDDVRLQLSDGHNLDQLSSTFINLAAGKASPCRPTERPSSLLAEASPDTMAFGGYVWAYDRQGDAIELEDVQVNLHVQEGDDTRAFTAHTDDEGIFTFTVGQIQDGATYQVEVRLKEATGIFQVHHMDLPGDLATGYTTLPRSVEEDAVGSLVLSNVVFQAGMPEPDPVHLLADGTREAVRGSVDPGRIHDAALLYAEFHEAYTYGRDRLGVAYDHELPEIVRVGDGTEGTSYHSEEGLIGIAPSDAAVDSVNHPEVAYHETGHHIHLDSAVSGEDRYYAEPGQRSHGGVANPSSADSLLEGLATFLAVLVKGEVTDPEGRAVYMLDGAPIDLQRDQHDLWNETLQAMVPDEAFDVAALLWDVMDADEEREPQDRVAWGLSTLWDALEAVGGDLRTIRDLYEGLKEAAGEPLSGPQDPPTDLDQLFINHRFYSDDGDGRWEQGEAIGYADYHQSNVAPGAEWGPGTPPPGVRYTPDRFEGPWLDLEVRAPNGSEITPSRLTMRVVDQGTVQRYHVEAHPATGRFPLHVPAGAEGIELVPALPGRASAAYELTQEAYGTLLASQGTASVDHANLTADPSELGAPADLSAVEDANGTVVLSWTPPPGAEGTIVVRGAGQPPSAPWEGVVVHEGPGAQAVDPGPAPAGTTGYAAFAIGEPGEFSQATSTTYEAPPLALQSSTSPGPGDGSPPGEGSGDDDPTGAGTGSDGGIPWSGAFWFLVAILGLAGAYRWYHRRSPGP